MAEAFTIRGAKLTMLGRAPAGSVGTQVVKVFDLVIAAPRLW
jgi:hypothetical protein